MGEQYESEWVSLGEAAGILGVHPSTVRHWADSGELASRRTPGGHRRFRRADLAHWSAQQRNPPLPNEAQLAIQNALGRARLEISGGNIQLEAWYQQLSPEARQTHAALGRRLLEIVMPHLEETSLSESLMLQLRAMGEEYARISFAESLTLTETVRAFLTFRDMLSSSILQLAEMMSLRTAREWGERIQQINRITDELLLALIAAYQNQQP